MQSPAGDLQVCARPDGRLHGPLVEYFPRGGHRVEGTYDAGDKHGDWHTYYDGGALRTEEHYDRGKPTGSWIEYFADGTHAVERRHQPDGSIALRTFRPDGRPLRQGVLVDGVESGEWTEWDPAGTATTTNRGDGGKLGNGTVTSIGIAPCDEYITKLRRCIADKVPEALHASMSEALTQSVTAWQATVASAGRSAIEATCQATLDAARRSMATYGCEW